MTAGLMLPVARAILSFLAKIDTTSWTSRYPNTRIARIHTGDPGSDGTANISQADASWQAIAFTSSFPYSNPAQLSTYPVWTNGGVSETVTHVVVAAGTPTSPGSILFSVALGNPVPWLTGARLTLSSLAIPPFPPGVFDNNITVVGLPVDWHRTLAGIVTPNTPTTGTRELRFVTGPPGKYSNNNNASVSGSWPAPAFALNATDASFYLTAPTAPVSSAADQTISGIVTTYAGSTDSTGEFHRMAAQVDIPVAVSAGDTMSLTSFTCAMTAGIAT